MHHMLNHGIGDTALERNFGQLIKLKKLRITEFIFLNPNIPCVIFRLECHHQIAGKWPRLTGQLLNIFDL